MQGEATSERQVMKSGYRNKGKEKATEQIAFFPGANTAHQEEEGEKAEGITQAGLCSQN